MNRVSPVATGTGDRNLAEHWEFRSVASGSVSHPEELPESGWIPSVVPTTAAAALRDQKLYSFESAPTRFDADDWWWRIRFAAQEGEAARLIFEGLATLAEVWLNGVSILTSDNMFVAHACSVNLSAENRLAIRFRSVDTALGIRRPRPRWRAPMVENQQLRYIRTTLLGRTPGWSPPAAAVGPWRMIRLESRQAPRLDDVHLASRLEDGAGSVEISCVAGDAVGIELLVERKGVIHRGRLDRDRGRFTGRLVIPNPEKWWPHTHGDPACYHVRLSIETTANDQTTFELGSIGFRDLRLDTTAGDFSFSIGGVPLFCRGACWTPIDPVALSVSRETLEAALDQVVACGMNMLRVGGTMVYESDDFYDLCDQKGILVWQDFMFANLDYPDDESFIASVSIEVRQILKRLRGRPSLALLCGSSEAEQQAAMWGAPRTTWSPPLFHEIFPKLVAEVCPEVAYWPSSAHGGAFPHQPSEGTTSYYGVGAYLRPLHDARLSEVRFASECLAFANIPGPRALPGGPSTRAHHPAWKARTPRDLGAGWDFDDVRDHYLQSLYGVDPVALRSVDHERYVALGRVVTGEVMASVFFEWRRARSVCRGGLIWFLRDLWPGAGWGIIQADGIPKAAYHYVRRALQPVAVFLADEGCNGLVVHLVNERLEPLAGVLEVIAYQRGEVEVARAVVPVSLSDSQSQEISLISLLESFQDLSAAYRFGPPMCDIVIATLRGTDGGVIAEEFHFPHGRNFQRDPDLGLTATVRPAATGGGSELIIRSRKFAQAISIEVDGFTPADDFFHLSPGCERSVRLIPRGQSRVIRGTVQALNGTTASPISTRV